MPISPTLATPDKRANLPETDMMMKRRSDLDISVKSEARTLDSIRNLARRAAAVHQDTRTAVADDGFTKIE